MDPNQRQTSADHLAMKFSSFSNFSTYQKPVELEVSQRTKWFTSNTSKKCHEDKVPQENTRKTVARTPPRSTSRWRTVGTRRSRPSSSWPQQLEQRRAASLCEFGHILHQDLVLNLYLQSNNKQYSENSGFVSFVGLFRVNTLEKAKLL